MAHIVFLDFLNGEVVKIHLTDKEVKEIDGAKYNEDLEAWATDKRKDVEWSIDFSNSQWMWFDNEIKERVV